MGTDHVVVAVAVPGSVAVQALAGEAPAIDSPGQGVSE
jgi:hypothetical protein